MDVSTEILAFALFVIAAVYWFLWRTPKNTAPGPSGLPIVGYLPYMTANPHLKFHELRKEYGPVFSLTIGSKHVVVLNDYQSVKKAFAMDSFFGRPDELPFGFQKETIEKKAFNGLPWKPQRRFCLQILRDLGFGKTRMEEHIKEEILYLLDRFEGTKGKPTKIASMISPSMSNNIASLVFGRRMQPSDPDRILLDKCLNEGGKLAGQASWQIFFPWVWSVWDFFRMGNAYKLRKVNETVNTYIKKEIEEHEKTIDVNSLRDFIDMYLLEIQKNKDNSKTTFIKPVLMDLVSVFFGAGSETVRIAVEWLMLAMAAYPEVQKRVQAEIDEAIGRERFPSRADYVKMPYTEATIMEILRWQTTVPLNILRSTLVDTEINGYFVPKDSQVIANLWSVHHDTSLWGPDTEVFRPERFLSDDGKELLKPEYYIPFSAGKRACPGDSLAKVEVFMYFTAILQKFSVKLPPGGVADFEGELGVGLQPKKQEICFELRS